MSQMHATWAERLEETERDRLHRSLRIGRVSKQRMADALGIHRNTIGSTLEGLLADLSLAHASTFAASAAAPKVNGVVKPLNTWTLSELIAVSRALGLLGEDVAKHADQVRNFRNYIHPRQQLKEHFEPRIETARIAQQVLRAALADFQALSDGR